jgi:hypothetical protein
VFGQPTFIFGPPTKPNCRFSQPEQAFADAMGALWVRLARTGTVERPPPSSSSSSSLFLSSSSTHENEHENEKIQQMSWPAYGAKTDQNVVLEFDPASPGAPERRVESGLRAKYCDLIDSLLLAD